MTSSDWIRSLWLISGKLRHSTIFLKKQTNTASQGLIHSCCVAFRHLCLERWRLHAKYVFVQFVFLTVLVYKDPDQIIICIGKDVSIDLVTVRGTQVKSEQPAAPALRFVANRRLDEGCEASLWMSPVLSSCRQCIASPASNFMPDILGVNTAVGPLQHSGTQMPFESAGVRLWG